MVFLLLSDYQHVLLSLRLSMILLWWILLLNALHQAPACYQIFPWSTCCYQLVLSYLRLVLILKWRCHSYCQPLSQNKSSKTESLTWNIEKYDTTFIIILSKVCKVTLYYIYPYQVHLNCISKSYVLMCADIGRQYICMHDGAWFTFTFWITGKCVITKQTVLTHTSMFVSWYTWLMRYWKSTVHVYWSQVCQKSPEFSSADRSIVSLQTHMWNHMCLCCIRICIYVGRIH